MFAACADNWGPFEAPDNETAIPRRLRVAEAEAICATCPVFLECDDYAERRDEKQGVWAGRNREQAEIDRRSKLSA